MPAMFLYAAENIRGWRQLALGAGIEIQPDVSSFYDEQIWKWIFNNWNPGYATWGLTKDLMYLMMVRWMSINVKTWGFSWATGFVAAKTSMINFLKVGAAATAVPLLTFWAGLMLIRPIIWFIDLWQKQWGINTLPPNACILKYQEQTWWCGLYKRPEEDLFYAVQGRETNIPAFLHLKDERDAFGIYDEWQFHDIWMETGKGTLYHYVYGYSEMRVTLVGKITRTEPDRFIAVKNYPKWWTDNYPVGWEITTEEALAYSDTLHEDFET